MNSKDIITKALDAVSTARPASHGDASLNFAITNILWKAYDDSLALMGRHQESHDVAQKMVLAKMSRILVGDKTFEDHYVDQCGYSALAGQLASQDPAPKTETKAKFGANFYDPLKKKG